MRKMFCYVLLASLAISANAQFNAEKTPLITKSLSADNIKSILAETSGGNISVSGVSASQAKIEVYVVPSTYKTNALTESEIKERMNKDYDVVVEAKNNKLTATAKAKDRKMDWKKALNFSFKIYVPGNVTTNLTTSGGNIELTDLTGDQKFTTSGGNLELEKVNGKLDGTTSGGNIHFEDSKSDDAELTTSGGNIEVENCEGKMRITTSGGSLHLKDLKGTIKASTSGGNVNGKNVSGELAASTSGGNVHLEDMSCTLDAATSGGHIDVSIKELGKYVRISNSGGNIDLEVPGAIGMDLDLSGDKVKSEGKFANFDGKFEDDRIRGKLNGGGAPVTADAGSGRVRLTIR